MNAFENIKWLCEVEMPKLTKDQFEAISELDLDGALVGEDIMNCNFSLLIDYDADYTIVECSAECFESYWFETAFGNNESSDDNICAYIKYEDMVRVCYYEANDWLDRLLDGLYEVKHVNNGEEKIVKYVTQEQACREYDRIVQDGKFSEVYLIKDGEVLDMDEKAIQK